MKKNKKEVEYICTEEYNTTKKLSEEELKVIFNKKYFNYIKRLENRMLGGCNFEDKAL